MTSANLSTHPQSIASTSDLDDQLQHSSNQIPLTNHSFYHQQYLSTPITPITPTTPDSSHLVLPTDQCQSSQPYYHSTVQNYLTTNNNKYNFQSLPQQQDTDQPPQKRPRSIQPATQFDHPSHNHFVNYPVNFSLSNQVNLQQTRYHQHDTSYTPQRMTSFYSNNPVLISQPPQFVNSTTNNVRNQVTQKRQRPRRNSSGVQRGAATGLKSFAQCVANKLRNIGKAVYTSIADELVNDAIQKYQRGGESYNEAEVDKNVRRRVYDALNVFCAVGLVFRCGKQVEWRGTAHLFRVENNPAEMTCICRNREQEQSLNNNNKKCNCQENSLVQKLRGQAGQIRTQLDEKKQRLKELRHEQICVQQIVRRNAARDNQRLTMGSDVLISDDLEFIRPDRNRVDLPFVLVSTAGSTHVSIQMEDGREQISLHFDSKFRIHDGFSIVRQVCEGDRRRYLDRNSLTQNHCSIKEEMKVVLHEGEASPVTNIDRRSLN